MPPRERDIRGRPLNARPRDGLGRPLPRGSSGVARVPDGLVLPPDRSLTEAQRLLDEGLPFHAHEVLEGLGRQRPSVSVTSGRDWPSWRSASPTCGGVTTPELRRFFRRGRDRIVGYAGDPPHDIDVQGLVAWADALIDQLARRNDTVRTPVTPRLVRSGGD